MRVRQHRAASRRPKPPTYEAVKALAFKAVSGGGTMSGLGQFDWRVAGGCTRPLDLVRWARPSPPGVSQRQFEYTGYGARGPLTVTMHIPCRQCKRCLQARRDLWLTKSAKECAASTRTWFGTITLRPDDHFKVDTICRSDQPEFDELDPTTQLKMRNRVIFIEITKYLKRLRKVSKALLRYLLVTELHKSGLPHYHILIHEMNEMQVTKMQLQNQWKMGFTNFKLIKEVKQINYVCKYLSKEVGARVRSSLHYGSFSEGKITIDKK